MKPVLVLLALTVAAAACAPDPGAEERTVRTKVYTELSTKDLPVLVGPVVMQDRFAIVDWTRGSFSGGRTLLRKDNKTWTFVLCGGAPLKRRTMLEGVGVPDGTAGVLATKLLREESQLDSIRRNQIDQWGGLRAPQGVSCPEPRPQDEKP